jgi:hypothetical protein
MSNHKTPPTATELCLDLWSLGYKSLPAFDFEPSNLSKYDYSQLKNISIQAELYSEVVFDQIEAFNENAVGETNHIGEGFSDEIFLTSEEAIEYNLLDAQYNFCLNALEALDEALEAFSVPVIDEATLIFA